MFEIVSYISEWALGFIGKTGYSGIFILSALESAAIPIPSEVVVPFSGFLAVSGKFNFWMVVTVATIANLAGSVVLYFIGKSGGRWLLEKYGKYVLIHKKDIETGDRWFLRHGVQVVFWGRLLPVVRTFVSLPAGVAGIKLKKFVTFTALGALPWNLALAFVGFKAGENWDMLHGYFRKVDVFIVLLIAVLVVWYFIWHKKRQHQT